MILTLDVLSELHQELVKQHAEEQDLQTYDCGEQYPLELSGQFEVVHGLHYHLVFREASQKQVAREQGEVSYGQRYPVQPVVNVVAVRQSVAVVRNVEYYEQHREYVLLLLSVYHQDRAYEDVEELPHHYH